MKFDPVISTGPFLDLLVPLLKDEEEPFVVLLGAGCSCQYGLPNFTDLLYRVAVDLWPHKRDSLRNADINALREGLDPTWRQSSSERIRRLLRKHLQKTKGNTCPGYRTLAQLAKNHHVSYFVNMNFDTLLEEAFAAECVRHQVVHKFSEVPHIDHRSDSTPAIYIIKPNGSLSETGGHPILDIAQSDLAANSDEETIARELFKQHHVLILGYSGIDARIAQVLGESDRQLFVANLGGPGPHLNEALIRRNSLQNSLQHTAAAFAYLAECLHSELFLDRPIRVEADQYFSFTYHLSMNENLAAVKWRQLAHEIQSTINVLAFSGPSLERHAQQLFDVTQDVASASGIALTNPEIFILRALSYVHDLGLYRSLSPGSGPGNTGLWLLANHGFVTYDILDRYLREPEHKTQFGPESYSGPSRVMATDSVLRISQLHGRTDLTPAEDRFLDEWQAEIGSCSVSVRPRLLHGLVVLAEELLQIMTPSKTSWHTIRGIVAQEPNTVSDDPVLAAFTTSRNLGLRYSLDYGRLTISATKAEMQDTQDWFLCRVRSAFKCFSLQYRLSSGDEAVPLSLQLPRPCTIGSRDQLLASLAERLSVLGDDLEESHHESSVPLLDLLSIHCLPLALRSQEQEPRLALAHPVVQKLHLQAGDFADSQCQLLFHYFESFKETLPSAKAGWFRECFERILYPGWRYLAHQWQSGVQPVSFAPSVLRFGSSHFRPEVLRGLSRLLSEGVFESADGRFFHAHRGCMLCTGSLLSALSLAQSRLSQETLGELASTIATVGNGVVRFLESPRLQAEDWLGFFDDSAKGTERLQSVGYLARAIQGLADLYQAACKQEGPDADWIPSKDKVGKLLLDRWSHLLSLPSESIVSTTSETNLLHNLIDIASCWLISQQNGIDFLDPPSELLSSFFDIAATSSQLDRSRAIPILLILADATDDSDIYEQIIHTLCRCIVSPVWIETGTDAGSYGYNEDTTEELLRSLYICWIEIYRQNNSRLGRLFPPFSRTATSAS